MSSFIVITERTEIVKDFLDESINRLSKSSIMFGYLRALENKKEDKIAIYGKLSAIIPNLSLPALYVFILGFGLMFWSLPLGVISISVAVLMFSTNLLQTGKFYGFVMKKGLKSFGYEGLFYDEQASDILQEVINKQWEQLR